jgi:acetolactate synthase-1/2/3 large subunit
VKVSDCLVKCLEQEGVEYVFGVPGEENEDLMFSLDDSDIEFIPTRHEGGAAFIANVWGRLTGEAGVCLATLGPGASNLMTGVADANLDKSPLVAITGQGDLERLHQESHQYLDVVNMMKPVTEWNSAISHPNIASEVVRKAFKIAEREKPSATHIELSEDVARADSSVPTVPSKSVRRPDPNPDALNEAADLIGDADKPLVIAGNGAIRSRCSNCLRSFVEQFDLPVVHTFMGKGAVDDRDEHSLLAMGLGFRDYVMDAVEQADLVFAIGYDIAEYDPESWNPDKEKSIVHLDFEPAEVFTHYNPEVEIVCDVASGIREMSQALEERSAQFSGDWYQPVRQRILDDIESYRHEPDDELTIPGTLLELRDVMEPEDLMISDVGSHKMWIARNFPTYEPNGCIISNGMASMGIALPGGIAGHLSDPSRNVVSAMGDGGFMMNSQELETAKRVGSTHTNVVFRDDDFGLISWKQSRHRGRSVSTEFTNPDFKQYAESFDMVSYHPTTPSELTEALEEAVPSDELNLVEVPISTHVNEELTTKLDNHHNKE